MQNKTIEALREVFSRNLPRRLQETPDSRAICTVRVGVQSKHLPNTEVERVFLINWSCYFSLHTEERSINNVKPS